MIEKEIECEIRGLVQNVGYRNFVKKQADDLEILGYVENKEEGFVEVVAQGQEEDLNKFIEALEKGPIFSRVDEVDVSWHEKMSDSFTDFEIL